MRKRIVYLTGFMGSGKSTIGPILANTIGYNFLDLDKQIEKKKNLSINEIFSTGGEGYFRELEKNVVLQVSKLNAHVISLGGGTVTKKENLETIKNSGVLVYLKANPMQIFHRLRFKADRPLMKNNEGKILSETELLQRIKTLLQEREPFYNQADVIVNTDDKKVGYTVDEIVKKLRHLIE